MSGGCPTCGRYHAINHDHIWEGDEIGNGTEPKGTWTKQKQVRATQEQETET